ncbi:hypothetical protein ACLOJK_017597 [Asimina triloba]
MASLPALPQNNSFHVRSTSLPSASHPLVARVEEEIKKLEEAWRTPNASSSPSTVEAICDGLGGLGVLYDCIQELLHMPLANHQNRKWAEDALDGSLRLLDMCSTTRDILLQMKEHMQSLRSALRRKGESTIIRSSINEYISSIKRVKKDINKCLQKLKEMDNNDKRNISDQQMSTVGMLLRETRVTTISILQSILSLLSASRSNPKISSKWSLVSRLMHKAQVARSDEDQKDANEAWCVDIALHDLLAAKDGEMERVQMVQRRLEAFQVSIERLEGGLESMFRFLIQNRVSLLNIFSQ